MPEPRTTTPPSAQKGISDRWSRRQVLLGGTGLGAAVAVQLGRTRLAGADDNKKPIPTKPAADDEDDGDDGRSRTGRPTRTNAGTQGIALLQGWMEGTIPSAVVTNLNWTFAVSQVGNYALYIPAGWSASEETDPTPADFNDGFTTSTMLASPDDDARFYVYDVALLPGIVTMEQFVSATLQLLANGEEIEVLVDELYSFIAPDDASFAAARIGNLIVTMQTFGSVFVSSSLSTSSYSSTIQIGAADDFDRLAAEYFHPILSNFERFSGGSGDSTPTPTPTS